MKYFFFLFLTTLQFTQLQAEPRDFLENAAETHLQSDSVLYEITPLGREELIGHDGKVYQKLHFQSEFEAFIQLQTRDTKKAERILTAYAKLCPFFALYPELQLPFEQWLRNFLPLLGCAEKCLKKIEENSLFRPYSCYLKPFFMEIGCTEHTHAETISKPPSRIVILTTTTGGGELMVARAVEKLLSRNAYEVIVLDSKELQKETDIFYQYSGMRHEDIYSEVFQKENNLPLAYKLTNLAEAIREYIPDNSYAIMKQKIAELQPDLIITTRYSYPLDISFAYDLNVPLRFIHSDYRFSPELRPYIERVDPELVRFWVPEANKECIPLTDSRIEVVGYPIRESFLNRSSPISRAQYGVKSHQKVLLMMMGLHGVGKTMLDLLKRIQTSRKQLVPMHIAVICGHNSSMKEEIEHYLEENPFPGHIKTTILGLLDEATLADYYSLADGFVGKAGGSTTSELIQMNVPAIQFTSFLGEPRAYEWEEANLRYLTSLDLGLHMKHPSEFIPLLHKLFQKKKRALQKPQDWQKRVLQALGPVPKPNKISLQI